MLRFARPVLAALIVYLLYLYGLDHTGLLGPDEPRYASIGREMATSGDWLTPRLWGKPWFEKPAFLYWMIAAGFRAGLSADLAPRLPVALLSAGFLFLYWMLIRERFGDRVAWLASAILATSAGWIVFSRTAVTDLPLSAAFSISMLLCIDWLETGNPRRLPAAGAAMGIAVLAKALVPVVLALPLVWLGRKRWRDGWRFVAAALIVAGPWYIWSTARYGSVFLDELIIRHHFSRVLTDELKHVQPFWFYVPVLLGALFPWTPLILLWRPRWQGVGHVFLGLWTAWAVLFFSIPLNKLPGYLLPMMPAAAALLALSLAETRNRNWPLMLSGALLGLTPLIGMALPMALEEGLRAALSGVSWGLGLLWIPLFAAVVWIAGRLRHQDGSAAAVALLVAACIVYLVSAALPEVERQISARPVWQSVANRPEEACLDDSHRDFQYGMNYYSVTPLPDCETEPRRVQLRRYQGLSSSKTSARDSPRP